MGVPRELKVEGLLQHSTEARLPFLALVDKLESPSAWSGDN